MSKYHIVMGENRFEVQSEINTLMENGFVPHGALLINVIHEPQLSHLARIMFTQAMIEGNNEASV